MNLVDSQLERKISELAHYGSPKAGTVAQYTCDEKGALSGYAARNGVDESWATIIAGAGNNCASDNGQNINYAPYIQASGTNHQYQKNWRCIEVFDVTAAFGKTITGAKIRLYGADHFNQIGSPDINIYGIDNWTDFVNALYEKCQNTPFSTSIDYASFSLLAYNDFVLNASGIAVAQNPKTHATWPGSYFAPYSIRCPTFDVGGTEPPNWANNGFCDLQFWTLHKGDANKKPILILDTIGATGKETKYLQGYRIK